MRVLGVDISSSITGWALIDSGSLFSYGAMDIKTMKKNGVVTNSMLWGFGNKIKDLIKMTTPDFMAVENIYLGQNPNTHKILAMMSGVARYVAVDKLKQEVPTIMPSQVNKFYEIKGNPKRALRKNLLVERANELFNTNFLKKDNDIVDAIGIAFVAYQKLLKGNKVRYI